MQESLKSELQQTKKEIDRLVKNRAAFYEIMSDMIFLFREDYIIEDMNQSAIATFGDQRGKPCHLALYGEDQPCQTTCPIQLMHREEEHEGLIERKIGEKYVEFSFVPFHGYQGDRLVMVVMRDITRRKQHELEMAEFNNNIEAILRQKIWDLKESEKICNQLAQEVNILQKELERFYKPDEMVGESRKIRELREVIYQVAGTNATILITGESGTGKELIADLIHKHSDLRDKPYLKFNCAAVSESLLESDLFGYEKGAFTGATTARKGKFEIADKGTIFLDEIGDISPKMQASLLRVLQNGEIIRVGGTTPMKVNIRMVAATNVDLAEAVERGTFRKDLYYRLNVINLHLPPLRERKEDIVALATHFIKKYRDAFKKDIDFLPNRIINRLLMHDWPGNIRELENVIQRAVLLAKNNTITDNDLDFGVKSTLPEEGLEQYISITDEILTQPLKETIANTEKMILTFALKKYAGKRQQVAEMLGLGKSALYEKIKRYGL